ncbi:hypothetical protein KL953_29795 [Mycolicibacterium goodii]|uniref:hypothetical protein n=1 Tax=Mycolicibacterium goodii TaxID=134601 RepID=UPI001BDD5CE6|nr:hypothetical protein [Mycolicibacterium goodii]MBU8813076.1 hypothetical protein [Mycolicibacterium goodii]
MTDSWQQVLAVADAVLYEGYLLYPYRADAAKNQCRWQWGVLGPAGAESAGIGEDSSLSAQLLVRGGDRAQVTVAVRFLQLQHRSAERARVRGSQVTFEPVGELTSGGRSWLSWDEAVAHHITFGPLSVGELVGDPEVPTRHPIAVPAGSDTESVDGGRLVRIRRALRGELTVAAEPDGDLTRVTLTMRNCAAAAADRDEAIAVSFIGTHLIAEIVDGEFVSLLEPEESAAEAVSRCRRHRCFPVLAGPAGGRNLMLVSPIILYDYPQIADQSTGALYDSCEIDEILTLRVMAMTDEEKMLARATDPLAAQIIDRCDSMSAEAMLNLHGVCRDSRGGRSSLIPEVPDGVEWWDPLADRAVDPAVDAVLINGVPVSRGSRVRLHPARRADAQDLFFHDQVAWVASIHEDVDGERYVGVVLDSDPAADLHDWYGRYLYFAPDEVEPLPN